MRRIELLLEHIDIEHQQGLEIGALCNPVVPPECAGISYVDHLDRAGLRQKYATDPNVDTERIVPVRYVWTGGPLVDVVGARRFDYVVASHVIEHVPDLVGWLRSVAQVLRPAGVLSLAVPDMRYTFDCQRKPTTIAELLEAYLMQYRRPSIRQVLDHFVHNVDVPGHCSAASLWADSTLAARVPRTRPMLLKELGEAGVRKHFDAIQAGEYIDTHCTVVTPESFLGLLTELAGLDLIGFCVKAFHPTAMNDHEFIACLEKLPDEIARADRAVRERCILDRMPRPGAQPACG
jgi:SAM-dependent methyltransferase